MELHSPAAAKRLWNLLRVAFFMMRKGLISKRKLLMDMNLMMKRGKIMGKSLGNLVFHHHHHRPSRGYGFSLQEYEFSCTTSPNPVFFHANKPRRHNYFPCLSSVVEGDDETPRPTAVSVPRIGYSPSPCSGLSQELASGENKSPLLSPLSVRVSNYSSELEAEAEEAGSNSREVDNEAEDFIRRFYEQLRVQSRIALIEYQEMEYQDMLERGH
ncbi:uncharacterized protein M6B38_345035 [Iris pallida]|uniref:DUF761 domain-containing protein n=1 Tax=Iris pallida TaxID=29817 RepID=A0AAX6GTD5_IRIPA|nr:uncharacterized protein M6B38_345035 [Iris pallida]